MELDTAKKIKQCPEAMEAIRRLSWGAGEKQFKHCGKMYIAIAKSHNSTIRVLPIERYDEEKKAQADREQAEQELDSWFNNET